MRILIIGAGFAGLSTAKILKAFGHTVSVFEKEADVGGVWSAARRYPGLTTQTVRSTYALSDFPSPDDYPEWPSGEQVQAYLASYARHFQLDDLIQLNTEVIKAQPLPDGQGWAVHTQHRATGAVFQHVGDYLVVCNGIFSEPLLPDYSGASEFVDAGGRICHSSQVHTLEGLQGQHVLVVGYGKSSCDVAQALSAQAAATHVVARELLWKIPKRLLNVVNFKYLLLTRLGQGLFKYRYVRGFERFLHGVGRPLRNLMLRSMQWVVTRQCHLEALGLVPALPFDSVARSTVSLVTEGFYEGVAQGRIQVHREAQIRRLFSGPEGTHAELSNGQTVRADVVVCGTGWVQRVPFLADEAMQSMRDRQGNFRLYRSMLPVYLPRLAFNGYNASLFCQLNCEMGALWLADLLGGRLKLPSAHVQNDNISNRLAWMEAFSQGHHAKGTNLTPFSLHHLDELLADLGMPLSPWTRFMQWLLPINPTDYRFVTTDLLAQHRR